jgi:hypothetical protein
LPIALTGNKSVAPDTLDAYICAYTAIGLMEVIWIPFLTIEPLLLPKKALEGMVTKVTALAITLNDVEYELSATSTVPVVDISEVIYSTILLPPLPVTPLL